MSGVRGLSTVLRVLCAAALSIAVGGVTVTIRQPKPAPRATKP